ncbi:MAG: hypothetical protein NHG36_17325 [Chromatiaceae bacterium]|nr:hypothetical protein [Candidatus Thioaporhodococcus sediminis]
MTRSARSALHASRQMTVELPDELNPKFIFSLINKKLLLDAAAGRIDLNALVRRELANRGIDENGSWIGFDRAEKLWN